MWCTTKRATVRRVNRRTHAGDRQPQSENVCYARNKGKISHATCARAADQLRCSLSINELYDSTRSIRFTGTSSRARRLRFEVVLVAPLAVVGEWHASTLVHIIVPARIKSVIFSWEREGTKCDGTIEPDCCCQCRALEGRCTDSSLKKQIAIFWLQHFEGTVC